MKLSSIPVVKLPIVDASTDPLDLLVLGLALRMKQLARTSPKFIELTHDRQFRIQIGTDLGVARQIIVNNGQIDTVSGAEDKADFVLQFADSEQGVKTLMKGDPTAFMTGMQNGSIKMEGDFSLLVWFNQVAKLIPPKVPKPVKDKIKLARQFLKEKTGKSF
ncbi:SCP2 sterol-binding domain-containing protein [Acinetobacter rongchengensis]|uniref:SCP-2 sterol transfer family protein n=1 Tax=Acinetobacter rongchengensis TaxID=2419601 RepID=A0A3A8F295_9GAMM|nr:SCP2 sterol-binding domain-containing protein [Acinetobacter rongchengensis]RKG35251.1 SCP-2 sterol transfer family protein [Acinetobacter rongchengensis]